jgi:hypothetical protein
MTEGMAEARSQKPEVGRNWKFETVLEKGDCNGNPG